MIFRKVITLGLGICAGIVVGKAQSDDPYPANTPADIFLLIGQSNMAGVAHIESLDTLTVGQAFLFNNHGTWEPLKNTAELGTNRYSTVRKPRREGRNLSPGYTFAKKMVAYTGRNIGVVSNARGGTRVSWWQKGYTGENDFDLYEKTLERANAALIATPGAVIKGIIWHQGEGDNSASASALYLQELGRLVKDLRTDLGDSTIFFIAGEVGTWNGRGTHVNPQIRSVKDSIANADFVGSTGLTSMDIKRNDPHFDTLSQRALGGRYADRAFHRIYGGELEGATLYSASEFYGRSVLLVEGDYVPAVLEGLGILVSEIKSIKLDMGYKIEFLNNKGNKSELKGSQDDHMIKDPVEIHIVRVSKM